MFLLITVLAKWKKFLMTWRWKDHINFHVIHGGNFAIDFLPFAERDENIVTGTEN